MKTIYLLLLSALACFGQGFDFSNPAFVGEANYASTAAANENITDGLVVWVKMDEGTGTTAADSGSSASDFSFTGTPSWITGKIGGALTFSSGNYLTNALNASTDLSSLTITFWTKVTEVSAQRYWLGKPNMFALRHEDETRYLLFSIPGVAAATADTTQFSLDVWFHVAVSFNTSTDKVRYYINGTFSSEATLTGNTSGEGAVTKVGAYAGSNIIGSMDELRIYNRVLSDAEVTSIYNFRP